MTSAVARHRTAMARSRLSRPLATALSDQLLSPMQRIFDYGSGRGDDVRHLRAVGFGADGWDPVHRPGVDRTPAEVVNLGYVVNVIEDRVERAACLQDAWSLAKRLLIVSARLTWDARDLVGRPLGDGLLTRTGTFQKFFTQTELAAWIETVLGVAPLAAAPGIFYVFRDPADAQNFLSTRVHSYRPRVEVDPHAVYETYRETVAPLLNFMTAHARPPRRGELDESENAALCTAVGGVGRAVRLIQEVTSPDLWQQVTIQRRAELLIYIALSRFSKRPRSAQLPPTLAADIRTLFGSYQAACVQADRLLLACGDPAMVLVSARSAKAGKPTPSALYVHRSALGHLPPVLQVYEGCARVLAGMVQDANLIKLSVTQPQVSYLSYPTFDRDAHPTLASAVTVHLRRLTVDWRDYRQSDNPPLLHRKEEFLGPDDPKRSRYERLTNAETRAGLYAHPERIGTLKGWEATLVSAGVRLRGHRLVRHSTTVS
ncbi:DNA phosphorothioation-associated putative methyltransferase [Geodermatophilus sabuli]|uniref:DNA phosphorothioation-associated putative methyltransferase n=1 Tax=Geodermatophilus sabuli TaxID=1564158 RepID=A0A285EFY2_9ACTN|nr:DNA phosphorothioation-associated putative methyltransferase [Geodermatophilus sabuli]MBB3084696.1 DNA phosphorothioation-associated putative methyltransferase [Geodermatophilus sabuli]SNX97114.1 DNA phosphorothioation-associated putative methyltransferase [Geodermatophilus sabuli]